MYQIWKIYLDWGHDCKKWVSPTFSCKVVQSDLIVMKLTLDMSRLVYLLNVPSYKLISQSMLKKTSGKLGRTDRQIYCHGMIRPFFKLAYKNYSRKPISKCYLQNTSQNVSMNSCISLSTLTTWRSCSATSSCWLLDASTRLNSRVKRRTSSWFLCCQRCEK